MFKKAVAGGEADGGVSGFGKEKGYELPCKIGMAMFSFFFQQDKAKNCQFFSHAENQVETLSPLRSENGVWTSLMTFPKGFWFGCSIIPMLVEKKKTFFFFF